MAVIQRQVGQEATSVWLELRDVESHHIGFETRTPHLQGYRRQACRRTGKRNVSMQVLLAPPLYGVRLLFLAFATYALGIVESAARHYRVGIGAWMVLVFAPQEWPTLIFDVCLLLIALLSSLFLLFCGSEWRGWKFMRYPPGSRLTVLPCGLVGVWVWASALHCFRQVIN